MGGNVTNRKGVATNKQQRSASQDLGMPVGPAIGLSKASSEEDTFLQQPAFPDKSCQWQPPLLSLFGPEEHRLIHE
jgi:hypothetical protein